jgi:tetratricopeptide (TPR) repeat protein
MSAETVRRPVSKLLSGRWQVPLALVAAVTAGLALYRLIPPEVPPDPKAALTAITALEQMDGPAAAANALAEVLKSGSRLAAAQRAPLHARLADLLYRLERQHAVHDPTNLRSLLEHDERARQLGQARSPQVTLRDALADQWLGDDEAALAGFRAALHAELGPEERRTALRGLIEVLAGRPSAQDERRQAEAELLSDDGLSSAGLWSGLHGAVREALDGNDTARARDLLARYGDRLKSSDLRGYLDYLWACVLLHEGRPEEAAPLVRWVDAWLTRQTSSARELDDFGRLPSLNHWLAGKVNLADHRPDEALSQFDEALAYQPGPVLRAPIGLGRGVALAALKRHAAALDAFQLVMRDVLLLPPTRRQATLTELCGQLTRLAQQQESCGDYATALRYLELAASATPDDDPNQQLESFEHLGRLYQLAAEAAPSAELRRERSAEAGRNLERAANLARLDEPRRAGLLWSAVDEYDQAGQVADARRMLLRFVQGRSSHPAMPQALLRLGQTYAAGGANEEALAWYRRVIADYPRLEEAARAKELIAGVLASQGPKGYTEAVHVLSELLADGSVAPDAAVYRDALLDLCDLLYNEGRYGEAIGRLHDLIALYPDDPEQVREQFTLADAYRRSAYALREAPTAAAESRQRFREAAKLYDGLLAALDTTVGVDAETQLYTRLALFDRADCLFELNEPEALRAALAAYRAAAARYETQPAALTAQVQIANVCLRLGDVAEAGRAIELARWLLRAMPAESFARSAASHVNDRAAWEQFLSLVAASDLFQVGLASTSWPPHPAVAEEP